MIRVRKLDLLLEELAAVGVTVMNRIYRYDYSRFAWMVDAKGNKVELWEPICVNPH